MRPAIDCPNCGSHGLMVPQPCEVCGHAQVQKLLLINQAGTTIPLGFLPTKLNDAWARSAVGDDAVFWAKDWQMRIELCDNEWILTPNPAATNQTMLDGAAVTAPRVLESGMIIGVGREEKAIIKTPLKVQLD